jgi:peptidoglycan/LPS O-acetylase OafA/YrhL
MIGSSIVASPEDGLDKLARHARGGLVLIAAVQLVAAAFLFVADDSNGPQSLVPLVVTGALFAALAVWARRNPLPPVIAGLALFVASLLIALWVDPTSLLSMWPLLMNGAILTVSINGLMAAREHARAKQRLQAERAAR